MAKHNATTNSPKVCSSERTFPPPTYCRYQDNNQHDEAVRDLEHVFKKDRTHENKAALTEGKRLQKLAKRKDYYKILGISRNADSVDIKKAYRKCALQHHPDRHSSAEESVRQEEEKIFKEVSEAYSVLSDPRKKSRYDSGQDLEDMMETGGS